MQVMSPYNAGLLMKQTKAFKLQILFNVGA